MYSEFNQLLSRGINGDDEAKGELLERLKPLIIYSIRRYYNRRDQYEDLIQEGYEVVLKAIGDFDEVKGVKFLGYLKSLLKYHYLEKHRIKEIRVSLNSYMNKDGDGGELIDFIADDEILLEDIVVKKEVVKKLFEGIEELSDSQRDIVILYYFRGLSMKDISKSLKLPYRTVVSRKDRALSKLWEKIN